MARTGRPMTPLTERDMETLGELVACQNSARDYHRRCGRDPAEGDKDGFAPLDFGGSNGSHHGATAAKLAKRGFAERKKRGQAWGEPYKLGKSYYRGSAVYRPTPAGRQAFEEWHAAKRAGEPIQVFVAVAFSGNGK